ncbi:14072_t:CDS:2 [Funneliformis geosporum]|nr:14072_t:CDS:2 [Funneliformis geosporum]
MEENEARFNNSSMPLEDSAETETNTSNSQSSTKLNVCEAGEAQILPKNTKVSHDYIVAQDFIQEVSSELIDGDDVQVIDGNQELTTYMTIEVELAHLFLNVSIERKNTTQAKQKEISCHYSYGKRFEESVQEIIARDNVSDKTIKKPNSYSECKDIEKVRPKVPLEKSQVSAPKKLLDVKISIPPTSQTSKPIKLMH